MTTRNRLSRRAAARRLGIHRTILRAWNECGVGPLPDENGRYDPTAVTRWAGEMSAAGDGMLGAPSPLNECDLRLVLMPE